MLSEINRIRNSVVWSAIDKVASSGIQLVLNLVLARLILPEEFALVAMVSIIIAIGQTFIDSGFSQSLIHKQNRKPIDYSTVFLFNIGVSALFYLIIFFISPFIAAFYNNGIFVLLTRIVALNLIISSFSIVQRAELTIRSDFKTQALVSIVSIVCSGIVGIYMAYNEYGVWAMITQSLSYQFLVALLLWILVGWMPALSFSKQSFKELFNYGSKLLVSRLINTICQNIHSLLIGKYYSNKEVAYFSNANQISLYSAGYLNEIIQRALFPIQCEMQDNMTQTKQFFYKMMRLSSYIIFPIMVAIIVLAKPFIITVLTDRWQDMILYMQIIAFAYMWYPIMSSNQMFNVLGRTDLYLKIEIIKKIFFVIIVFITLRLDVVAMCLGIVVYNFIEMFVTIVLLKRILSVSFKEITMNIIPSLCLSLCMACITYLTILLFDTILAKLIIGSLVAFVSYIAISYIVKSRDLLDIIKIIKIRKL